MNFLLVEDNEMAAWVIRTNLERLNHKVDVAKTGPQALRLFHRGYDAIFLDVGLPELNGIEVAKIIRNEEAKRNIILGISNLGDQVREECLEAGFDVVYKKPTDVMELLKIVKRVQDAERSLHYERGRQVFGGMPTTNYCQVKSRTLP